MPDEVASPWTDADRATWRSCCTLETMRGWWAGSDCMVVGGGSSATEAWANVNREYDNWWTIGCNRAVEFCEPDFAACFEPRKDRDVWAVAGQCPGFILSHIPRDHPRTVLTGSKDDIRPWLYQPAELVLPGSEWVRGAMATGPKYRPAGVKLGQSMFYAIASAVVLGFATVAVIGLDLTQDRYDDQETRLAEAAYKMLFSLAEDKGSRLINLNPDSRLQAIPTGEWNEVRTKWA